MKTAFIIAEYNPFHNGHLYHIEKTKEGTDAEAVVAVMSGNFVQRGDIAIGNKFLRAESAVRCGVDLVVELPVKYAVSNAVHFAKGAVQTIKAFGIGGEISFGASSSLEELQQSLSLIEDKELLRQIEEMSRLQGKTYPAALDAVLRKANHTKTANILNDPNNVLALEYLKALAGYNSLLPFAVERKLEKGHLSETETEGFASAKYIRDGFYEDIRSHKDICRSEYWKLIPENAAETLISAYQDGHFPADRNKYDVASYSRLLCMTAQDFIRIDNVSHGLENRIAQAIKNSSSTEEAIATIKSKRYTMARLRQIFTAAVLGVTKEQVDSAPSYLRVLAFNETGRRLLARLRSTAGIPIVTNLSDIIDNAACAADAALEYGADKLYDLCLPAPRGGNRPFLEHSVYIRNNADR